MQLLQGQFPDWRHVLPPTPVIRVPVHADTLLAVLRRVRVLARDIKSRSVGLMVSDQRCVFDMEPTSENPEGLLVEEMSCTVDCQPAQRICFNAQYVEEALQGLASTEYLLDIASPTLPLVVRPVPETGAFALVMPVTLWDAPRELREAAVVEGEPEAVEVA